MDQSCGFVHQPAVSLGGLSFAYMEIAMRLCCLAAFALMLPGCIATTALDVVALPVKAASAAVDAATTSQSEADEKRGREIRRQEACVGREERRALKAGREADYSRCG